MCDASTVPIRDPESVLAPGDVAAKSAGSAPCGAGWNRNHRKVLARPGALHRPGALCRRSVREMPGCAGMLATRHPCASLRRCSSRANIRQASFDWL